MSSPNKKRTILVTGFGPFKGHPVNASWESVKLLPELWQQNDASKNADIIVDQIPVEYKFVQEQVPGKWQADNAIDIDFYVHVGVHGLVNEITLETQAHNNCYDKEDIEGCCPKGGCCVEDPSCPNVLKTNLNVQAICDGINSDPDSLAKSVTSSADAGRYLCDFVYFKSLHSSKGRGLFVHVPDLDKPYSKEQLASSLVTILKLILKQI